MRKMFVQTENYTRFTDALEKVENRGAREASMMLVHGAPGRSKTHILKRWAAENRAVYLRASVDWTVPSFLRDLAKALGADEKGTAQNLFRCLLGIISEDQKAIVIDESEYTLRNKAKVLEKIREFADRAEVVVVLIGMKKIKQMLLGYEQTYSRIARVVEFAPITPEDVALACQKLAEVEIRPAMMKEIHTLSKGRMREAMNIIAAVEHVAQVNGLATVDVADMQGVPISYDWQTETERALKGGRA